jgi:hypothetical protein
MNYRSLLCVLLVVLTTAVATGAPPRLTAPGSDQLPELERQFATLPAEARRLTGPLFWLHGDESPSRLEAYLEKVAEGGNGSFTAESRPHTDWLGAGWYRDLGICLEAAKKHDLQMWIFDEQWWPSGEVGGKVPERYASKYIVAAATEVDGPRSVALAVPTARLIAVLAGNSTPQGSIDGNSLVDLSPQAAGGNLRWDAPAGRWKVMTFTWEYGKGKPGRPLVDGASREAVDWYLKTVYQPHYDHFPRDFGKTIVGYFYDEPESPGDWGTEVFGMLASRGVDWKKALTAWKFTLADAEEQLAAKYQYQDAFAEAWGRTLYGGISAWCRDHEVLSIGHFLEHDWEYLRPDLCAGNMFQLQKYTDLGGIDLVCQQFYPGSKDPRYCQMAKLGSSIAHVYGKTDDLAMCEMFGAYGQAITYPQMKWLTDQMQVRGINFMIPHSFNPRAPYDRDCPPFFYNDGYEPRWPLYRVYADYTSRLSLLLSGGRHVCPVAFLYLGNSRHAGKSIVPEQLTTALQDALFDCDWMPYDVWENDVKLAGRTLQLHQEQYRVLVVPAVEVIPYATLEKVKTFFEAGGLVVGYGMLPSRSATLGKSSADVARLREAVWGTDAKSGVQVCRTNQAGGRSYFLPEQPTPEELQQVLTSDAGVRPTLEVLEGQTDHWLYVLHRQKAGCDVFFVCNQQPEGAAKSFRLRAHARGVPECWDAMRNEIRTPVFTRVDDQSVDLRLTLEPMESVLLIFRPSAVRRPPRLEPGTVRQGQAIAVERIARPVVDRTPPRRPPAEEQFPLAGCSWVWSDDGPGLSAPPCTRYFRKRLEIPAGAKVVDAKIRVTADNSFVLHINGQDAGAGQQWNLARVLDATKLLDGGTNVLAVTATNGGQGPNPAGLIGRYLIRLDNGQLLTGSVDPSWKCFGCEVEGWKTTAFDDSAWGAAKPVAPFGAKPWGTLDGAEMLTLSPVKPAPFAGRFTLPAGALDGDARVRLEADEIRPEDAAAVKLNGRYVGGFVGKPYRLDLTGQVRPGGNTIEIEPFAPSTVRVIIDQR